LSKKYFIKINNEWLINANENNIFTRIGTEGFAIYCVLLQIKNNNDKFLVNIKQIQKILSRDYDKRPEITYSEKKINYINVTKGARTIKKYLTALAREKLIETEENIDKIGINDFMIINIPEENYPKGFTPIANDLIIDKIHKIGHVGLSLLYILTNLFNKSYGGEYSVGFANPTEKYLASIIKRDVNTVRAYLYLLKDKKLIKILPQPKILLCYNKAGEEVYQYISNHYIVNNKLSGSKYYLEFNK